MKIRTIYQVVEHFTHEWGSASIYSHSAFSDQESAERNAEKRSTKHPDSIYHVKEVTLWEGQEDEE